MPEPHIARQTDQTQSLLFPAAVPDHGGHCGSESSAGFASAHVVEAAANWYADAFCCIALGSCRDSRDSRGRKRCAFRRRRPAHNATTRPGRDLCDAPRRCCNRDSRDWRISVVRLTARLMQVRFFGL